MTRKPMLAAVIAAAFAFPMAASANDSARHTGEKVGVSAAKAGSGDPSFSSLDTDGDGYISKAELAASKNAANLKHLDKDGDGRISRAEYTGDPNATIQANTAAPGGGTVPNTGSARDASGTK